MKQAHDQYAAFAQDWDAYAKSSGQKLPELPLPGGAKG